MNSNLNAYVHLTAALSEDSSTLRQMSSNGIQGKLTDLMPATSRHQKQAASREILASQEEESHLDKANQTQHSDGSYTEDEKFGLLSAYLDDEVSDEERCLVNHWLKSDSDMKQTYRQQLQLRAALKMLSNQSDWE